MTLGELSQMHDTRKFRCRHALKLQDFLVLGPTKLDRGVPLRFSVLNLDTGLYNDVDATSPGYVLLSTSVELGHMNYMSEIRMLKIVRANY